jgi:hypothetical protein
VENQQKRRLVEHIRESYNASRQHRRQRSYLWEQCKRFDEGHQWLLINDAKGLEDRRDDEDMKRCVTFNHVTRLVTKMVAMATQSEPEAYPVPVSDSPLDREACEVAEAIAADEYRKIGINTMRMKQARSAIVQTSSYRYWRWDKDKEALVPDLDPVSGEVRRAIKAPLGGLQVDMIPGSWMYWDPAGNCKHSSTWGIIARHKPIVWLQGTYGAAAYGVQPDVLLGTDGNPVHGDANNATILAGGLLPGLGGKKSRPNACLVLEYLEKPNPKHPQGVYAVVAGDKLLYSSAWPWADKENWPLAEMAFLPLEDSPYAQGAVEHLIEAQAIINEELSRIKARLDKDKRVIYVQRLSNIGADAFEELRDLIKIYYNPGSAPPVPSNLPPISADHFTMLNMAVDYIETFSGIVDVLNGQAPPGVTAGVSIDLLVREASTQFKPFINSLEQCEVDFMRGVISEYADKAPLQLMIGMDRKGNPRGSAQERQPLSRSMSLQALADGGMVDIYLVPGSGLPRSEAGKKAERTANYQAGLYGQPGSPEALKLYWELSDEGESYKVLESLEQQEQLVAMVEESQAALQESQAQIAQLEQALAQAEEQLGQAGMQIEQLAAGETQAKTEQEFAKAQIQQEQLAAKAQLAAEADNRKTKHAVAMRLMEMATPPAAAAPARRGNPSTPQM